MDDAKNAEVPNITAKNTVPESECENCYVVDPNTIMSEDKIMNEKITFKEFPSSLKSPVEALMWLATRRLVRNYYLCPTCKILCHLEDYPPGIDCKRWRCTKCKATKSVRDNSFFSRSHFSFAKILQIMLGWAEGLDSAHVAEVVGVDKNKTIKLWFCYCRKEIQNSLKQSNINDLDVIEERFRLSVPVDKTINFFFKILAQNYSYSLHFYSL